MFHVPNESRVTTTPMRSTAADGNNGAFVLPSPEPGWSLVAIASDGLGWEHVSVRAARGGRQSRVPTWREMCFAKDTFWGPDDVVMQLHPARSAYVDCHPHVLHLWRPVDLAIPLPPVETV